MRLIKNINTIAIMIPFIIAFFGLFDEALLMLAIVSTMVTGLLQVVLGIILLIKNPKNWYFISYMLTVILFFALWYVNMNIYYSDTLSVILYPIPLLLTIYLSVLIYKRKEI